MRKGFSLAKIKTYILAHKSVSIIIGIIVVGSGYGIYTRFFASNAPISYALATVTRGTLVSSVSGSGQVAARQVTAITSTVSADVVGVYVNPGDEVRTGTVLARLDTKDALKAVSNAELALENARLSYQKAVKQNADQVETSASSDTAKAYQSGYNAIANTLIDLPAILGTVGDIFYNSTHSPYFTDAQILARADSTALIYKNQAGIIFDSAKNEYETYLNKFKSISPSSSPEEIVTVLNTTNSILKKLLSALTSAHSTIDYISDRMLSYVPSEISTDKSVITSFVSKVNTDTTAVTNALTAIDNAKDSSATAELSMKSAQLSVRQAEDTLNNAEQTLYDHSIRAPYDGLIAKVPIKTGDKAVNGTPIATVVTKDQIVDISLNEIDAAKVQSGNKVELTFDAIDGLSLPGHVSNVDLVGTVSQGVVTYQVEIAFDSFDSRVKQGMSVSAIITTSTKENVLIIPSGAIRSQGNGHVVQVVTGPYTKTEMAKGVILPSLPRSQRVSIGDANDTMTEIIDGLSEGDLVVTRTITATGATAAPSILSSFGGRTSGTGAIRSVTR